MKTIFNKNFIAFACSLAIIGLSSCKEQTLTSGSLIPSIDNIHTFGLNASFFQPSLKVNSFDSVITDDYTYYIGGIGNMFGDPFFGSITEGLFIQFKPPNTFYSFPSGLTLDSAVVVLPYSGAYGDTGSSTLHSFNLYKITDNFDRVNDFYSFQNLALDNTVIGSTTEVLAAFNGFLPSKGDSLNAPSLKITLNNTLASSIFNADNSKFISSGAFAEFLHGFYIGANSLTASQKSILYFKLIGNSIGSSAHLAFYTHDNNDSTVVINFPYDAYLNPFFTKITKDYTGTPASNFTNSTQNRDSVLIQGFPGFFTEITLNNINQIPQSIINKAELTLTSLAVGDETIYAPPARMIMEVKNDTGGFSQIADLIGTDGKINANGLSFVDGKAQTVTINGIARTQYKLNFPRELQSAMMSGKTSLTFRVRVASAPLGASRFIGSGFLGDPQTSLKTDIIYTKK